MDNEIKLRKTKEVVEGLWKVIVRKDIVMGNLMSNSIPQGSPLGASYKTGHVQL